MIDFTHSKETKATKWYLVCLTNEILGVIAEDDLPELSAVRDLQSAIKLSYEQACIVDKELSTGGYMSANCRIKAGESGGVG